MKAKAKSNRKELAYWRKGIPKLLTEVYYKVGKNAVAAPASHVLCNKVN